MIYKRSSYKNKNIAFQKNSINNPLLVFVFSVSAHCVKRREARKLFGVFRVKNHDFTPKNHIFFQFYAQNQKIGNQKGKRV
jgi:hypothetical protein